VHAYIFIFFTVLLLVMCFWVFLWFWLVSNKDVYNVSKVVYTLNTVVISVALQPLIKCSVIVIIIKKKLQKMSSF